MGRKDRLRKVFGTAKPIVGMVHREGAERRMNNRERKRPHIGVFGGINMDLVINCESLARPGETVKGTGFIQVPGGKGANQAVAAAFMESKVTMFGHVGDDSFGDRLLSGMKAVGVTVDRIERVPGKSTGLAFITVDRRGQNSITFVGGANDEYQSIYFETMRDAMRGFDAVLVQLECPPTAVASFIQVARESSVPIVLNPAPAAALPREILEECMFVIPNETEALTLTGIEVTDEAAAEAASERLRGMGCPNVIITMGSRGAYTRCGKGMGRIIPPPVVDAIDAVAAGDVFVGAFVSRYFAGEPVEEAVVFSNYAAALSTTRPGAQSSIPRFEEVVRFMKENGEVQK